MHKLTNTPSRSSHERMWPAFYWQYYSSAARRVRRSVWHKIFNEARHRRARRRSNTGQQLLNARVAPPLASRRSV